MQKLVTSKQIKDLESSWMQKLGQNGSLILMEKAGSALAEEVKEYKEPYLIVCGKGNNGGDGLVAARYLHSLRKKIFVFLISDESLLSSDAKVNLDILKNKVTYQKIEGQQDKNFSNALNNANTLIDCILGTGTNKKSSDFLNWLIKSINDSNKTVIACDIPTGVDPDTGNVSVQSIKAKKTVTFGYTKLGLVTFPGKEYSGEIKIVDIGLPDIETNFFLLDDKFTKENLPKRYKDSNKGTFGRTLLVCGSEKYPGAALLASKAASSIGSGLTSLATKNEVFAQITPDIPEVTHVDFNENSILKESTKASSLIMGPGLTTSQEIESLVTTLITKTNIPIILDADGINVLVGKKDIIKKVKNNIVLTPHPKELSRLLDLTTEEILNNKIEIVKRVATELKCTLLLKGPGTIIGTKDGKVYISPFANAALAKGGTGDVLAGFIGGLISQGLTPEIATCVGVYIHGKAGELVASDKTAFSLLPQDLITYLPKVLKLYI